MDCLLKICLYKSCADFHFSHVSYTALPRENDLAIEEDYQTDSQNKACNRPFARWRHFTTTTRILFVFPFGFSFGNPSEV